MDKAQYLKFTRPYERTVRKVLLDLEFFLEDTKGIHIYSTEHRIKKYESALKKSRQQECDISELPDIAGIRIVVATTQEINIVARFFSRQQEDPNGLKIKSDEDIDRENGYRAKHIVVEFKGHYLRSHLPTNIEIQLRTALAHAYNFVSHTWAYKSQVIYSNDWQKKFQKISKNLKEIDTELLELQKEVVEVSASTGDYEPLTALSCQIIVRDHFEENVNLTDAVDLAKWYIDRGCNTNGQLKSFFQDSKILDIRNKYLEFKPTYIIMSNFPKYVQWMMLSHPETAKKMLCKFKSDIENR